MKNINKIYNYIFLLFCFIIPFEHSARALPNIILVVLVLLFPFQNYKKSIQQLKKEFIAIFLFIAIIAGNSLVFQRWEDFNLIQRLLYIPLILILFSPIKNIKSSLLAFVLGSFSLLSISTTLIVIEISKDSSFALANGAQVNDLLFGHRPYLGFMYLMSTYFVFYLATTTIKKYYRILYVTMGIVFISFIFLIAARLSALTVLISTLIAAFYFAKKIKLNLKWWLLVPLFFVVLMYNLSDNLSKRFFIGDEKVNFITAEPRYYIWDCAYTIMSDNPKEIVFGKGYYQTENDLALCYQQKENYLDAEHKQWFIDSKFNTHNQFLDFYLSQGIIVLCLSLLFFCYLFIIGRKDFFSVCLLVAALLFLLVENVLTRQLGCILIAFLLCFVFHRKLQPKE
ncbi:O-antigen ligase family protein [Avrilella dinanensis]|uniref:O-antigen ligase-related domain-containing protein n=1 Tax=Avrilella dinanensis TaxID=2008672 RepID=A0A2M9R4L0_9FLAO|nr:O-antigen ligase family protein [Avrilella dinanensis]PJR03663.1 hypothetical protein CDL10_03355 [Avrilella dinanensis]